MTHLLSVTVTRDCVDILVFFGHTFIIRALNSVEAFSLVSTQPFSVEMAHSLAPAQIRVAALSFLQRQQGSVNVARAKP